MKMPSRMNRGSAPPSVIVRAAQVIAAVRADQFAVVAREAMTAVGADLAMVVDVSVNGHTTL